LDNPTDPSAIPLHERPTEPPEDEPSSPADHERETLPPYDRDRPTMIVEDPNLGSLADACRVIVTNANILSRCETFTPQTRVKFRIIGSDLRKLLCSPASKSSSKLKAKANKVLSKYVADIEKAMRLLKKPPSSEEMAAYNIFQRANSLIESI